MRYFTIKELTKSNIASRLGICNNPNKKVQQNLEQLINTILDPLREAYGHPIIVTSGYRCPELNNKVGGSRTSQHVLGQAADIRSVSDSREDNKKLFDLILSLDLPFDQLIDEYDYDWVHVSFSNENRKQILHIK